MTNLPFKLLDTVTLSVDLPDRGLQKGQSGTIVEILANGTAFEVEFNHDGRVIESLGLLPYQISKSC